MIGLFQRDYLVRMINQMTEAMGQIVGLRRQMKQEEALQIIDDLLDKRFRLSGRLIRSLSEEELIKVMTTNGLVERENVAAIAYLLKQEALLRQDLGKEAESYELHVRALKLFLGLALLKEEPELLSLQEQIEEQLELLSAYELPAPAKRLIMSWHEAEGHYDQMENVLYELYEDRACTKGELAAAYERLLRLDDEALLAGRLSRDEVEASLAALTVKEA